MATSMEHVELELCPNCKKEIPQSNYVMHTMHCARNICLCPVCKEPVPKGELEGHKSMHERAAERKSKHERVAETKSSISTTTTWKSAPYTGPLPEKLGHAGGGRAVTPKMKPVENGVVAKPPTRKPHDDLSPCKYCELELPKDTMREHEDYCGTRTEKCDECGEFVMFKYKKLHEESNHGFVKLSDEPGPRASWDASTSATRRESRAASRRSQYDAFDMSALAGSSSFNVADYLPPSLTSAASRYADRDADGARDPKKKIDYKDLSRRLDCKAEYIRNLLHDSANITAPLRTTATAPRNHFNHNKGPAPQPPAYRRPNPPTELTIPCEFCHAPIPHEDLIQHETGCRPDLARFNPRRRRQQQEEAAFGANTPSPPSSPEVELPCEFCSDMIPASQLLRHQATCN